jgi:hypothetical protein
VICVPAVCFLRRMIDLVWCQLPRDTLIGRVVLLMNSDALFYELLLVTVTSGYVVLHHKKGFFTALSKGILPRLF